MKPQEIVHSWSLDGLTPEKVHETADNLISVTKSRYDKIGSLKEDKITYESVIQALVNVEQTLETDKGPLEHLQHIGVDKSLRGAALEVKQKLSDFEVEIASNKDIFDKVLYFRDNVGFDGLVPEFKRWAEKFIINGKREGLHLDQKKRDEIKELNKKISTLENEFSSHLNDDDSFISVEEKDLQGVSEDTLKSFERDENGRCKVTMKYPHYYPTMSKCKIPETRRRLYIAFNSRCKDTNTKILEKIVELRHKKAVALEFENYAAFIEDIRMAKNPKTVSSFLEDLSAKLQPLWKKEKKEMLELKENECKEFNIPFDGILNQWDERYYHTVIEETKHSVNKEKLREYFPLNKVTKGLFDIYQELLGLTFTLVPNVDSWHEDVSLVMYKVEDTETKELLGYFFVDLYPRDGKYGHACIYLLQQRLVKPDGSPQVPVCVMLTNFTKPTSEKPSLLNHDEVQTYFHEFGHIMHFICSKGVTGQYVEMDFLEAPSQMLENWCWEKSPLQRMSGHYKTDSPLPDDLLDKLIASRMVSAGRLNLQQMIYSTFDLLIHTRPESDVRAIYYDTEEKIKGMKPVKETSFPASFLHMIDYPAQYYSYPWSEVFSFDMYESRFVKEGIMNPKVGMDYRNFVLVPGGTKDAADILRDFLGRDPKPDAFLRAKGLSP